MKDKYIYIVMAHRWGDPLDDSYFVSAREFAIIAYADAMEEEYYRGRKYKCSIEKIFMNDNVERRDVLREIIKES